MGLDVTVLEFPAVELLHDLAEESASGPACGSGLMKTKPPHVSTCASGREKSSRVDVLEVPVRRDELQIAVERPGPAVKGAAELRAATVVVLQGRPRCRQAL